MCVRLELFMKKIFSALDPQLDDGSEFTDIALDSIGLIGSTPDGKMALEKHRKSLEFCLEIIINQKPSS